MRSRWLTETKVMPLKKSKPSRCDFMFWTAHSTAWESSPSFPCSCSYSQCQFSQRTWASLEAAVWAFSGGIFEFSASSPYPEGASNEPVSIVYVYAGVGVTKWEWPSNWQWSHSVSVVLMVRSQPAGSAGDPGRQERHSQTKGMPLIRQRCCWHQGRACPTNTKCHPGSTVSRSPDVCYLGKAHFMAKINNEMSSTSIPPSLFCVSGEITANGALPDSELHKPERMEIPPQGFRSQRAVQTLQTSALLASSSWPHTDPAV